MSKAVTLCDSFDLTLISTGGMLRTVVEAAKMLKNQGLSARVISMPVLKPIDTEAVEKAFTETGFVFTVEEHSLLGGLGSAVAEVVAKKTVSSTTQLISIGFKEEINSGSNHNWSSPYMNVVPITANEIVARVKHELQ